MTSLNGLFLSGGRVGDCLRLTIVIVQLDAVSSVCAPLSDARLGARHVPPFPRRPVPLAVSIRDV
jgi:hypothetical protein